MLGMTTHSLLLHTYRIQSFICSFCSQKVLVFSFNYSTGDQKIKIKRKTTLIFKSFKGFIYKTKIVTNKLVFVSFIHILDLGTRVKTLDRELGFETQ